MVKSTSRQLNRRFRVLQGEHAAALFAMQKALTIDLRRQLLWVGEEAIAGVSPVKASAVHTVLGSEVSILVFDAHVGFHPDAFAAALGTLCGGGELILLLPKWQAWSSFNDPDKQRLAPYPLSSDAVGNRFIGRLQKIFSSSKLVQLDDASTAIFPPNPPISKVSVILNGEQQMAVDAIERVARGHAKRPLVITADRGRGKSTALGQAIAQLMQQGKKLLLLAPNRLAVEAVFDQIERLLPEVANSGAMLNWQQGSLQFVLPDEYLQQPELADLLLVDEAAAIPLAVLAQLLERHNRLVFSTTVHGYEGTGRGFELRFSKLLGQKMPQWKLLRLVQPVRWASDDPLEHLLNRGLLLDVDISNNEESKATIDYCWLNQDALVSDESLLRQVYGLLLAAHYQTRPSDLRQLLDAPCLRILIAQQKSHVVGVLLVVTEGGFDAALAEDVWVGKRRPRGHMLLQSLSCHAGYRDAPRLSLLRIMRIAVHPDCRREGIAIAMIEQLKQEASRESVDLLGVSYALDVEVYALWIAAGFKAARVGYKRDASSGQHSVQMLLSISRAGDELAGLSTKRFQQQLPWQLASGLSDLEGELVALLMKGRPCEDILLSGQDHLDLQALATGHRQWREVVPLWHWLCRVLAGHEAIKLNRLEQDVLIALILQRRSQKSVESSCGLGGAKAMATIVRQAVAK